MWVMPHSHTLTARVSMVWTIIRSLGYVSAWRAAGRHRNCCCCGCIPVTAYHCNLTSFQHSHRARPSFNKVPHYLADSCTLVSNIASRQHPRSAQRRHLDVPWHNRSTLGRRSFSVAGPTVWNSLPGELRDQGCTESTFKQSLKTYLFAQH